MSQMARIVRLYNALRDYRAVSAERLMEELEASRATVMRDIEMLRDRLNVPIAYDRERGGYTLEDDEDRVGPRLEMPGLWLDGDEAYALLTLINVLNEIGPGMVVPYVTPLRGLLKQRLSEANFRMRGFDRKVSIELGDRNTLAAGPHERVSRALIGEKRLRLEFDEDDGGPCSGEFSPQRLALTGAGWHLDTLDHATGAPRRIAMAAIHSAVVLDTPATLLDLRGPGVPGEPPAQPGLFTQPR